MKDILAGWEFQLGSATISNITNSDLLVILAVLSWLSYLTVRCVLRCVLWPGVGLVAIVAVNLIWFAMCSIVIVDVCFANLGKSGGSFVGQLARQKIPQRSARGGMTRKRARRSRAPRNLISTRKWCRARVDYRTPTRYTSSTSRRLWRGTTCT